MTSQAGTGVRFPLASIGVELLITNRVFCQAESLRSDDCSTGRSCRLQPGGGIHDVAGGERVSRPRVDFDHRLAGGNPNSDLQIEAEMTLVEFADPLEDAERGADRSLRVVAARKRRPKHRHDCIARVFLNDPSVPFDAGASLFVVQTVTVADVFWICPVGPRRGADLIDEENRDELALLPRRRGCEFAPA